MKDDSSVWLTFRLMKATTERKKMANCTVLWIGPLWLKSVESHSVLLSRLFLSFHLVNCFYGREGRKLISWYMTDGHAVLKHFALTHIFQIKGFCSPCVSVESSSGSAGPRFQHTFLRHLCNAYSPHISVYNPC